MLKPAWLRVLLVASLVGIVALVSNITSEAQMMGRADTFLAFRFTISKLVNSGTVWGGLLVLAGWIVRRPWQAPLAGIVAGEVALVVHYGLGQLFGIYPADIWGSNWYWFLAPVIFGPFLGLIGAAARRRDLLGLAARLVVPAAAVVEPFYLGMLRSVGGNPPDRISSTLCGIILIAAGLAGAGLIIARHVTRNRRTLGHDRPSDSGQAAVTTGDASDEPSSGRSWPP